MFIAYALWVDAMAHSMNRDGKVNRMDDLISRKAAIEAIGKVDDYGDGIAFEVLSHAQRDISLLPSAERRGRWAKAELSAPSGDYIMFQCSECASLYNGPSSYCPNCGAQMSPPDEE